MSDAWITGLASIALEVSDLERSTRFYTEVWGMERVGPSLPAGATSAAWPVPLWP